MRKLSFILLVVLPVAAFAQSRLDEVLRSGNVRLQDDAASIDQGATRGSADDKGVLDVKPGAGFGDNPAVAVPTRACLLLPMTGAHGGLGESVAAIIESVFADSGIEIMKFDTKADKTSVILAIEQALAAFCAVTIGGLGDREAVELARAASARSLPHFSLGGRHVSLTGVVWAVPSRSDYLVESFRNLAGAAKRPVIHVIHADDPFGWATLEAAHEAALAVGAEIGVEMAWGADTGDILEYTKEFARLVGASQKAECNSSGILLAGDIAMSRRMIGFLDFDGLIKTEVKKGCPPPVLIGTSLWNRPALIGQSASAFEKARFAARDSQQGRSDYVDSIESAARLARAVASGAGGPGAVMDGLAGPLTVDGRIGSLRLENGKVSGWGIKTFEITSGSIEPFNLEDDSDTSTQN